jgi:hypothetical protein
MGYGSQAMRGDAMREVTIIQYITEDGKRFDSETQAVEHEVTLKIIEMARNNSYCNPEEVAEFIVNNRLELYALLKGIDRL